MKKKVRIYYHLPKLRNSLIQIRIGRMANILLNLWVNHYVTIYKNQVTCQGSKPINNGAIRNNGSMVFGRNFLANRWQIVVVCPLYLHFDPCRILLKSSAVTSTLPYFLGWEPPLDQSTQVMLLLELISE